MTYHLAYRNEPQGDSADRARSADLAFRNVVGNSTAIREAISFARRVASRRLMTVLIVGETGTGKELFARGVHYASPEPGEPFAAVNCSAIPPTLLESELFGHERGAFTDARSLKKGLFELAGAGTLFLDEITDLPPDLQPKLLRALEERRVRRLGGSKEIEICCRVVAATNRSLEREVADGKFREDLFYRLNVLRLVLPPLRERVGDVAHLARHFATMVAREQGIAKKDFSPRALSVLSTHDWPGNVRELRNVIQRAALLGTHELIHSSDLTITRRAARTETPDESAGSAQILIPSDGKSMSDIEAEAIGHTLASTSGNRSKAARMLGISRPTLLRKINKYGLDSAPGSRE